MIKFKPDEVVKCVDTFGVANLNYDDIYTVVSCNEKYVTLKVGYRYGDVYGSPSTFSVDRFESLEEWGQHQVKSPPDVELSFTKMQVKGLQELKASHEQTLKESYSALLWLYRRLPRSYESPPHIESAIKNLAKALGKDAQEFIDERKGME